jgi:hypothetical protein
MCTDLILLRLKSFSPYLVSNDNHMYTYIHKYKDTYVQAMHLTLKRYYKSAQIQ